VFIEDVNDNSPVFTKALLDLEISELIPPGARFPLEMARDADAGSNSLLTYQLSSNPSFSLDMKEKPGGKKQPELVLDRVLDREKQSSFELVLMAVDGGDPARSGTVQVRINVTDANDNPPEFSKSLYEVRVAENLPVNSVVLQAGRAGSARWLQCREEAAGAAVDREEREEDRSAAGSPARCGQAGSQLDRWIGRTQYFALHGKTGHLVTAERIDREQLCERVQQCVLRCELIVEGQMQVYRIQVEIKDINDNAPSFREAEIELKMTETTATGSRFLFPDAHDPDSGLNSLQSYELSGDEHFSLAVQAGPGGDQRPELVLAKALDREEAAFHELVLRAMDGGDPARTGTARGRGAVVDANDNAPVFSQAEYTVRVPEDVPVGSVLVTVTATDADEGPNGHVKYSIQKISEKASQIFQVDSDRGAITLIGNLDFEEGNSYDLEVQAHDGGFFDTAKVVVTVTDVNDNAPEITVSSAVSEIAEDAPSGTVVALLHVQDRDTGANGK
ncbi:PREDICTED: protocadherin gamma-A12-like, partial [Pseudopodoces humilis]|uniref:protocadherin gamma-A12-like n=1 Tax=Pseudopodoces humilis TaxID=181119 RepID=UPI0006B6F80D